MEDGIMSAGANMPNRPRSRPGFTLVEVIISVGILAVMIPTVVAAMVAASRDSARARAENRAAGIVETCIQEVEAARTGRSAWLAPIPPVGAFPAAGHPAVLAFSEDGQALGRVKAEAYQEGLTRLDGKSVRYLARIEGKPETVRKDAESLRALKITVEFPSGIPANRRRHLEFLSRIP
jgi:prepilin-type N-terminal cleavage/methylation domain-containing protein